MEIIVLDTQSQSSTSCSTPKADTIESEVTNLSQSQRESQIISSIPLSDIYTLSDLESQPKERQFAITKNNKMSQKVDQLFNSLKTQLEDPTAQHTLVMGYGPHLARMISIVEILKAKLGEDLKDVKWTQYNRLEQMEKTYEIDALTTKTLKIPILYTAFLCEGQLEDVLSNPKEWTKQDV